MGRLWVDSGNMRLSTRPIVGRKMDAIRNNHHHMTKHEAHSPEPARFHRLKKLRIVGGFLDQSVFEFDENLNCLIGPRGSGKSTIIELIRFAFDQGPAENENPQGCRRFDSLIKGNLGDGRVELEVETKDGLNYTIRRESDEDPIILNQRGEPTKLDLRAGALFRPEIFSQNDVESIADQATFQLELIDSFCFEEIEEANRKIRQGTLELKQNGSEVRKLEEQIERIEEEVKTLPAVQEKLKGLAQIAGANSDEVNRAHEHKSERDKEQTAAKEANRVLREARERLAADYGLLQREARAVYPLRTGSGGNGAILAAHRNRFDKAVAETAHLLGRAVQELDSACVDLESLRGDLTREHQKLDLDFQTLIERFRASNAQSKERVDLEKRKNQLELRERELKVLRERLGTLLAQRSIILDRLSELRDRRFNVRHAVASRITAALQPNIRVSVVQNGERATYRDTLVRLLSGAGIRHNVVAGSITQEVPPGALADIVKRGDSESLIFLADINATQAAKVLQTLQSREALMELESVYLDDQPKIELKDGQHFKDSRDLSTGQKCTTILPILMLESENPLLIDQPEDNLDNSFVYSDVVKNVRNVKQSRQLLFVTHNPNIPVLGEAEQVFVLQSSGRSASVSKSGTVDECKEEIVKLLEGGEEAFKKRKERYRY